MPELINIKNGDRKATAVKSAFESVWKPKGWSEDKDAGQESTGGADEEAIKAAQKEQEKALKDSTKS